MDEIDSRYGYGDSDEFHQSRRPLRFPNFHNTSPLTYYPQRHIVELYSGTSTINRIPLFETVLQAIDELNKTFSRQGNPIPITDDPTNLYTLVLDESRESHSVPRLERYEVLRMALEYSIKEMTLDMKAIKTANPGYDCIDKLLTLSYQQHESITKRLSSGFAIWRHLCKIRNMIQKNHVDQSTMKVDEPITTFYRYKIFCVNEILILLDMTGGSPSILLINYEQFLMLVDLAACRIMCRLACLINDETTRDELPSHDLLCRVYRWGDDCVRECGMGAYAIIGEYESFITDRFVNFPGSDPLSLGLPFHQSVLETAEENSIMYSIPIAFTQQILTILSEVQSPNILSELFGIRKHWGHPMVDAKASGRAVQDKLREDLPIDGPAIVELTASFNRMITLEYIKRNSKWPKCTFPIECKEWPLYKLWESQSQNIIETVESHQHCHWAYLEFLPNCVISEYQDEVSFLSDKSVSLYRKNLDFIYVRALHPFRGRKEPEEKRRLLLEYLRKKHPSIHDICKAVMTGQVPSDWLCNSASMKGTEMKYNKARIFAVLPYELRQYFAMTEDMIKEHIFKYNPHQTMTMKEGDLLAKLKRLTGQLEIGASSRELKVTHIIDFSKWNLRMKYANTAGVFKSIDNFLGTPGLIESTHILFENMINVVQDAFNPPGCCVEDAESDTIWKNHICGWEGQRQKGWTSMTSAALSGLELKTGVHSEICGQGDNQVLVSTFPVPSSYVSAKDWVNRDPEGVRSVLDQFYQVLEHECSKIGLKVKAAETCRSLSYLNYGKRLFFNGAELSMSLKRISKMMTEPNDFFPTTEHRLKTQEGSIYAAGLYSHPGLLHYVVSRVGTFILIHEAYRNNPLLGRADNQLFIGSGCAYGIRFMQVLMKIPASLGGPAQQMYPAYMCRGHPDPLCTDLLMVTLRARIGDEVSRRLLTCIQDKDWYNSQTDDKESLIHAPHSLNLKLPVSAFKPLEREVEGALRGYCKNPDISELFSTQVSTHEGILMRALTNMRPFHPLVANDIFGRSLPGRKRAFITGFTHASSLSGLIRETSYGSLLSKVCTLEAAQLRHWVQMYLSVSDQVPTPLSDIEPHHVTAQKIRELSWGCEIDGVTVPHPVEQFCMVRCDTDNCNDHQNDLCPEHIVIAIGSESLMRIPTHNRLDISTVRSRNATPYLGNVITEGLTSSDLHCENPNSSFIDSVRLEVVKKWVSEPGSWLEEFMDDLIHSRTDIPLEVLDLVAGEPARRSYNHRAHLMSVSRSCAPCSTTNMYSRFYISSNRMGEYSHGAVNYHMAYGPAYLSAQALLSLNMQAQPDKYKDERVTRDVFHLHVRRHDVPVVHDSHLYMTQKVRLPSVRAPRMLFAKADNIRIIDHTGGALRTLWWPMASATHWEKKWMYAIQLIANSFVNEIVCHELFLLSSTEPYPSRTSAITIGDVRLVGIDTFCEAFAMNVLFHLPIDAIVANNETTFRIATAGFLKQLSPNFWKPYLTSMTHLPLLKRFVKPGDPISPTMTKSSSGMKRLLIHSIIDSVVKLWEQIKVAIMQPTSLSRLIIGAPSFSALKSLAGRYLQICFLLVKSFTTYSLGDVVSAARDQVANLHTSTPETFLIAYNACCDGFRKFTYQVLNREEKSIPVIKMFDSRRPWIDTIRDLKEADESTPRHQHERQERHGTQYAQSVKVTVPDRPLFVHLPPCGCLNVVTADHYDVHRYFTPYCSLDKRGHNVLEILGSSTLDISGLVFLGCDTGVEAAGVTSLHDNRWVYINSPCSLNEFSPHVAGTYMPAAFLEEGILSKVISPHKTALCTNSLSDDSTYMNITSQLDGAQPDGVVCCFQDCYKGTIKEALVAIEKSLIFASQMENTRWMLVMVDVNCYHDLQRVCSIMGCLFNSLEVIYPSFNKVQSSTYGIVASMKKLFMNRDGLTRVLNSFILTNLACDNEISSLCQRVSAMTLPPCLYIRHTEMLKKLLLVSVYSENLPTLCNRYIMGWGRNRDPIYFEESMMDDLTKIEDESRRQIVSTISTTYRVMNGLPIIRSNALMLDEAGVDHRVMKLAVTIYKARILKGLLKVGTDSVHDCISFLDGFLRSTQVMRVKGVEFKIMVNHEHFVRKHSGTLFEILGRARKFAPLRYNNNTLRLYHRSSYDTNVIIHQITGILPVRYSHSPQRPSNEWNRPIRSWIIVIFSIVLLYPESCPIGIESPLTSIFTPETCCSLNLIGKVCLGLNSPGSVLRVVEDNSSFPSLVRDTEWLIITCTRFGEAQLMYRILSSFYVPWSGVKPSRLLLHVTMLPQGAVGPFHPNVELDSLETIFDPQGLPLMGCGCWCCSIESRVCAQMHVHPDTVTEVCRLSGERGLLSPEIVNK